MNRNGGKRDGRLAEHIRRREQRVEVLIEARFDYGVAWWFAFRDLDFEEAMAFIPYQLRALYRRVVVTLLDAHEGST